jgi:cytochrome c peroxidase
MYTTDPYFRGLRIAGFRYALALMIFASCGAPDELLGNEQYVFRTPAGFPGATYTFVNNPVTRQGFELGRMLFYDPILSIDSTVSCGTCHKQATGFSDPTHRINHGVNNRFGKRNSPGLANMAFRSSFFYDGGANHLDFVPINAITASFEMDNTLEEVVKRLNRHALYAPAFKRAFEKDEVDSQQVLKALAQFTVMMVSANAKYDQVMRQEGVLFTLPEEEGHAIFKSKCASCHSTPLFTDNTFRNNGLDESYEKDAGRQTITNAEEDVGKFRVPDLRNVNVTPPYMHDGRFSTLDEVLDHYSHGVKDTPTLDPALKQNGVVGIPLTVDEKEKIIAFLKTLTDPAFLSDKRFTDPF